MTMIYILYRTFNLSFTFGFNIRSRWFILKYYCNTVFRFIFRMLSLSFDFFCVVRRFAYKVYKNNITWAYIVSYHFSCNRERSSHSFFSSCNVFLLRTLFLPIIVGIGTGSWSRYVMAGSKSAFHPYVVLTFRIFVWWDWLGPIWLVYSWPKPAPPRHRKTKGHSVRYSFVFSCQYGHVYFS